MQKLRPWLIAAWFLALFSWIHGLCTVNGLPFLRFAALGVKQRKWPSELLFTRLLNSFGLALLVRSDSELLEGSSRLSCCLQGTA